MVRIINPEFGNTDMVKNDNFLLKPISEQPTAILKKRLKELVKYSDSYQELKHAISTELAKRSLNIKQ